MKGVFVCYLILTEDLKHLISLCLLQVVPLVKHIKGILLEVSLFLKVNLIFVYLCLLVHSPYYNFELFLAHVNAA